MKHSLVVEFENMIQVILSYCSLRVSWDITPSQQCKFLSNSRQCVLQAL